MFLKKIISVHMQHFDFKDLICCCLKLCNFCCPQAYELLIDTLFDSSEKVASTSEKVFLPSFASWSQDLGRLESHLLTSLICNLENTLKVSSVTRLMLLVCSGAGPRYS